jgi:hypothetical protein
MPARCATIVGMHPNLAAVLVTLDDAGRALRRTTDTVPSDRRSERPAPDRWSAAQVLEHISLAEGGFTSWITSGIEKARAAGVGNETSERTPLPPHIGGLMADRVNRRTARDVVQPRGEMSDAEALAAIAKVERRLRTVLSLADGLALNEVMVEHPALGPFNVYQWIELMAAHRLRHAEQISEIAQAFAPRSA